MVSKKLKIVCSVKVSRLKFVSLTIADQLQQNFCKMLCVEQRIIKLDWKSTMHSVVKCPKIFIFIFLCLIFSQFLILFVYLINIRHWQVPFITQEHLGKPSSATSFFKCQGPLQLHLLFLWEVPSKSSCVFEVQVEIYYLPYIHLLVNYLAIGVYSP